MNYKQIISACEASAHLVSMVPVERVVEFGYSIGLNSDTSVLDFCCGYGEMLNLWNEAFGINVVGIDIHEPFIVEGKTRVRGDRINLIAGDIFAYSDSKRYDVVVCTELSAGLFEDFASGIAFIEKHLKQGG
ncbi:MAG: class I SAM-dependent methyltransferase [Oscillospiraceae bacterium]|jgi:2-polyprenyl-3-methyl-5-hydroxy-6-metoxy-1,4-benzoquinol methylase|nr:class I SAM-dependent methyltransferase [Oscillospiraceae bacterium]